MTIHKNRHTETAFIIGSPRSGTTILENILHCHPHIAELYEPYYLWENFFCSNLMSAMAGMSLYRLKKNG